MYQDDMTKLNRQTRLITAAAFGMIALLTAVIPSILFYRVPRPEWLYFLYPALTLLLIVPLFLFPKENLLPHQIVRLTLLKVCGIMALGFSPYLVLFERQAEHKWIFCGVLIYLFFTVLYSAAMNSFLLSLTPKNAPPYRFLNILSYYFYIAAAAVFVCICRYFFVPPPLTAPEIRAINVPMLALMLTPAVIVALYGLCIPVMYLKKCCELRTIEEAFGEI